MAATSTRTTTYLGRNIFYLAYFILLLKNLIDHSTIQVIFPTESFLYHNIFRIVSYSLIILKLFTQDRVLIKHFAIYITVIALSGIVFLASDEGYVIDIAILVVGAHGVNLKSVVKLFFVFASIATIVLLFLSITGLILNYKVNGNYNGEEVVRYSFGSTYPTDFAARIFYIEMAYSFLRRNKHNVLYLVFWLAIGVFIWVFCRARLNTFLIIIFALAVFINAQFPKFYKFKIIRLSMMYSMIIFCVGAILLHALYSPDNAVLFKLNNLLSDRLRLGKIGVDDYGFSLFGKIIEMNGNGFSADKVDVTKGYFFIDSGFLKIALTNGIVYLIFFIIAFTVVARKAVKNDNVVLAIIISFLALTSIVDHHIVEVGYNPFIFVISDVLLNSYKRSYRRTIPNFSDDKDKVLQ
ncbi:MAG: hypothetical protein HFK05_00105 [Clostridia bacterium]|nr:hypothetical protein [Clostridia bacterium]